MPRAVPPLLSFSGGELSPRLWARTDLEKYAISARELRNLIARPQGPAVRRPGTRYIAGTRSDGLSRLIGFEFSIVQAYVIEVAPSGFFRFFRDGGQILSGGSPYEVAHPYGSDLTDLQWVQSNDVLYLAHPRFAPRKLTRTGHTSWTLTTISFTATPSEWTGSNYPGAVAFHDDRLWWAGTPNEPQTMWASKTGDYENLTTGTAADDALKLTLNTDSVCAIRWMRSGRGLHVGTAAAEFVILAGAADAPITPSSARARRQTADGSADIAPVQLGQTTLFVQRAGRRVVEFAYSYDNDFFVGADLTVLADHIARAGLIEIAWQAEPWRVMWGVTTDGGLIGLTYLRDQRVMAWHRHVIGGGGLVRSIACIPSATANELWMVVERTINGTTRRYVERLEPEFVGEVDTADAFFVDAGLTYTGTPTNIIAGLAHLEGVTVQVLADGAAHPDRVVSGGTITLQVRASTVHVGFACPARLETLDIEAGAADGAAATRRRRIGEIGVRLYESLGCKVGYYDPDAEADVLDEVQFRTPAMDMDAPPPLFTGDKVVTFPGSWSRECRVVVTQEQPLPLTVAGLVPRVQVAE